MTSHFLRTIRVQYSRIITDVGSFTRVFVFIPTPRQVSAGPHSDRRWNPEMKTSAETGYGCTTGLQSGLDSPCNSRWASLNTIQTSRANYLAQTDCGHNC